MCYIRARRRECKMVTVRRAKRTDSLIILESSTYTYMNSKTPFSPTSAKGRVWRVQGTLALHHNYCSDQRAPFHKQVVLLNANTKTNKAIDASKEDAARKRQFNVAGQVCIHETSYIYSLKVIFNAYRRGSYIDSVSYEKHTIRTTRNSATIPPYNNAQGN